MQWKIDPARLIDYATSSAQPELRLRQIADRQVARAMLNYDIDSAIGPARVRIAKAIEDGVREAAARERLGVDVVWVGLAGVYPPQQVADDFNLGAASQQAGAAERAGGVAGAGRDADRRRRQRGGGGGNFRRVRGARGAAPPGRRGPAGGRRPAGQARPPRAPGRRQRGAAAAHRPPQPLDRAEPGAGPQRARARRLRRLPRGARVLQAAPLPPRHRRRAAVQEQDDGHGRRAPARRHLRQPRAGQPPRRRDRSAAATPPARTPPPAPAGSDLPHHALPTTNSPRPAPRRRPP